MNAQEINDLLHTLGVTSEEMCTHAMLSADRYGPTREDVEAFAQKIIQGRKTRAGTLRPVARSGVSMSA